MQIGLVGPYPPPYGGISVHVKRMEYLLLAQGYTPIVFKEMTVKQWFLSNWGKWFEFDVVHFHEIEVKNRILLGFLGLFGFRIVLTIHGDSLKEQTENSGWVRRRLLSFSMRHISHIVVVKEEIRTLLRSMGVKKSRISVINAYLPHINNSMDIPGDTTSFLDSHHPILVANGYEIVPLSETNDLYGVELSIDLCARLQKDYPELGFMFFLAQVGDEKNFERLKDTVNKMGIQEHFTLVLEKEFIPTLSKATIFIRPTYQDGYAISVSEAINLGIPTIASDVCVREKGAIIFKSGDLDDLLIKVRDILENYTTVRQRFEQYKPPSGFDKLLSIYKILRSNNILSK